MKLKKSDMSTLTRSATLPYATDGRRDADRDGAQATARSARGRTHSPCRRWLFGSVGSTAGVVVPRSGVDGRGGVRHRIAADRSARPRERAPAWRIGDDVVHTELRARLAAGRRTRGDDRAFRNPRHRPGTCPHVRRRHPGHRPGQPGRQPGLARLRQRTWPRTQPQRATTSSTGEPLARAAISSTRACGGAQPRHHHRTRIDQLTSRPVAGADLRRRAPASTPPPPLRRGSAAAPRRSPRRPRCPSPAPRARFPGRPPRRRRPSPPRRRPGTPRGCPPAARRRSASSPRNGRSLSRRGVESPIGDRADRDACEAAEISRRDLLQPERLPDRSGEADQHAETSSLLAGRDRQRVTKIARPVGIRRVRAAQRAGDHHGRGAVVGQFQPQRRFLHGVGAVRDDHAVGIRDAARPPRPRSAWRPSRRASAANCPPTSGRRPRRRARKPGLRRWSWAASRRHRRRCWRSCRRW